MSPGAKSYYEGLARGRDGNWRGLIDAQLKAIGHEGLWPKERPPEQDLYAGRTMDGKYISDPDGLLPIAKAMERASKYPTPYTYWYSTCMLRDCMDRRIDPQSIWDEKEAMYPWIHGTTPPFNPNAPTISDMTRTGGW